MAWWVLAVMLCSSATVCAQPGTNTVSLADGLIDSAEEEEVTARLRLGGPSEVSIPGSIYDEAMKLDGKVDALPGIYQDILEKRWVEAIRKLRPIIQSDPDNKAAKMAAVFVLSSMKHDREAIDLLSDLIKKWPDDYRVLNNLAWLLATAEDKSLRDGERAVELARKAILQNPNDYHIWSTLAESYYVVGEFEKAISVIGQTMREAGRQNAGPEDVNDYREQMWRFRQANAAFTLMK